MHKKFGDKEFGGTVTSIDVEEGTSKTIYRVVYDDGDVEDFYSGDLDKLLYPQKSIDKAQRYLEKRKRAIYLFKHYPVLDLDIKPGRGTARQRFFEGLYVHVKLVPLTKFRETTAATTSSALHKDSFGKIFGAGTFQVKALSSVQLYAGSRLHKWFRQGEKNVLVDKVPYPRDVDRNKLPYGAILDFDQVPIRMDD